MDLLGRWSGWARWALRQRGLAGALRMAAGRLLSRTHKPAMVHPFDRQHGVETSGLIEGGALGAGHRHAAFGTAYFGVPPSRMRAVLDRWRQTPGAGPVQEYTFLDVGCGKGRALMLASKMPFREAIGVELDPGLADIATQNLERWQLTGNPQCSLRVIHGDATEIDLPSGPLLIYLYNPFGASVLRQLLERLQKRKAATDVLYLYPREGQVFRDFPAFELLWKENMRIADEEIGVDELTDVEDPCSAYRLHFV